MKLCECGCGEPTKLAKKTDNRTGSKRGQPLRYLHGHNAQRGGLRAEGPEYEERNCGYDTPCWVWLKAIDTSGYGSRWDGERLRPAHRNFYERFVGAIPVGKELHHLCEVRPCVNPAHLAPVTRLEHRRLHPRKAVAA